MKVEIYRGKNRKWYLRFIGKNGRSLMTSEANGYVKRSTALNALRVVREAFEKGTWKWHP